MKQEWTAIVVDGEIFIESEDFTHDVRFHLTGDFTERIEALNYAEDIADKLNGCNEA